MLVEESGTLKDVSGRRKDVSGKDVSGREWNMKRC